MRNQPRSDEEASPVEPVRDAVQEDGVDSGIAKQNLQAAFRSWVVLEDSLDLFSDTSKHLDLRGWSRDALAANCMAREKAGPRPARYSGRE
jgi:hypothetical protein